MKQKIWAKMPVILLAGLMLSATLPVRGENKKQTGSEQKIQNVSKQNSPACSAENTDQQKKSTNSDLKKLSYLMLAATIAVGVAGAAGYGLHCLLQKIDSLDRD